LGCHTLDLTLLLPDVIMLVWRLVHLRADTVGA
jgi:hypothetical protein